MKRNIILICLFIAFRLTATGQIICIFCYDQNDSISSGVHNLVSNGGFENSTCAFNSNYNTFCPNSNYYNCDIANWTCTGGGASTYSCFYTNAYFYVLYGQRSPYFGNYYCNACSSTPDDTSCLIRNGCTMTGIPSGYPLNTPAYGGGTGISLLQTVNGLIPGNVYVLEFWAGGEAYTPTSFPNPGLFAVDVGFGNTFLRCKSTYRIGTIGTRFIVEFRATASSHTIKFTNWGHICSTCTELILDDVKLYPLSELSPSVPPCFASGLPQSDFASSDTAFCGESGECIDFIDHSKNNPTSWKWFFPGAVPDTSTQQNPTNICYSVPGTFAVTLITTNSAGSDSLTVSPMITFSTAAIKPFLSFSGDTVFCSHELGYQWYFNGAQIPGATDSFYVATVDGVYAVQITDVNGCVRLSDGFVVSVKNIYSVESRITVSPNPFSKFAKVSLGNTYHLVNTQFILTDVFGRRLRNVKIDANEMTIERGNLTPGVYFYSITADEKTMATGKILIVD